ncbi:gibberellin-regulated protein 14-like [Salvia splendens]|uniref:gibberellin-regulated protein 14-like n=1 Tax=Salvia splendens TaxID=180675 RepID=UPI001C25C442|nr:gibberellin-regulated protein 14-like [Salvia splendens]
MASKGVLLVLTCFLLINTKVSSDEEKNELNNAYNKPPPPLPPVVKASPPPPPPSPSPPPPPVAKASPPPPSPPRNTKECGVLCVVRCKNHSRKNVCLRACVTCCDRCKCVPPGQYGNREKCGKCYATMTTRGGKLKCP